MKQKHFIDSHKGATSLACLAMMQHWDQWENPTAWVYLALHGTYGVLWVIKSRVFGDRNWEKPCSIWYGFTIWGALSLYWVAPYLICSQSLHMPAWWLGVCIAMFNLGVFFHFASDMQKHITLKLQPGLITTGLWSRLRNPNYFGELLIYVGFAAIPLHWIPLGALALMIVSVWIPNMLRKDKSLSRYPDWDTYRSRSWRFIPLVW
jgi:protein-S-isoprenylcysteine O-methyltransferase Ste14